MKTAKSCNVVSKGLTNNSLESIYFHLQLCTSCYSNLHGEKCIRIQMFIDWDTHSWLEGQFWCLSSRFVFETQCKVSHPLNRGGCSPYQTKSFLSLLEDFFLQQLFLLSKVLNKSVLQDGEKAFPTPSWGTLTNLTFSKNNTMDFQTSTHFSSRETSQEFWLHPWR